MTDVTLGQRLDRVALSGFHRRILSLIAAGMQTYMQMQGGQQPGGPGGL